MNIVYTGSFRFPAQDAAAARVLNNAKALCLLGNEVQFLSWGGIPREQDRLRDDLYVYQGFPYMITQELGNGRQSMFKRIKGLYGRGRKTMKLLKSLQNVDIVIAYNPPLGFSRKCLRYCRKNGIYFVTDLTEWYAAGDFAGGSWSPMYWMSELNMRYVQKKVHNKIVISSFLNKYYEGGNNLLIPPLVDCKESKWGKKLMLVPDIISKHRGLKILFAGNPAQKDLLANILQAVLHFKGKIQMIVLGVNETSASSFLNVLEWQKYPESVVFMGRVSQEDVPAYYCLSDFSIIARKPNRKNTAGFPTKMVESYAANCPVVMNVTSDLLKYAINGVNAIVLDGYNASCIISGLERLLNFSKEDIQQLKKEAEKTAINYFDFRSRLDSFVYFLQKMK